MIDKLHRSIVTMNSRDLLVNILMLLCIFILKKTEVESAAQGAGLIKLISPRDVNVFLQEGDPLTIEFRSEVPGFLYRYVDGRRRLMDVKDYTYKSTSDRRYYYLRIYKAAITAQDAGQYICVTQDRGDGDSEEKSVRVQIAKTEPIHDDLKKEMDDVTIKCKVEGITSYRVVWQKDGETLEGDRYVRNDEEVEKALTIKKASRKDVGEYTCVFIPDPASAGAGNVSATPIVKSGPFVDPFHGSVSPWQGDEVVLTCKVYGNPMPDVSWTKDGEAIANSTKSEYSAYNGVENAQLTIRDLVAADRANYGCVASRTGFNSTKEEILVRVKDRYAAMWPFIGILIEVIILVVVIFIYERRKGKTSDDDSDSGGKTNSHDQRAGGDVRQRNTVRT